MCGYMNSVAFGEILKDVWIYEEWCIRWNIKRCVNIWIVLHSVKY